MESYDERKGDLYRNLEKGLTSHSIDGTDLITAELLRDVNEGFYVDIGANHPKKNSNTYYLYKQGWSGVAVDGNQYFEGLWHEHRPLDKFLTSLVSGEIKEVDFRIFPDDTMSSMNSEQIKLYEGRFNEKIINVIPATTTTLANLKQEYFQEKEVHLLSVDIEGEDLNCLIGANFESWKPGVVVVEIKHLSLYDVGSSDIVKFLTSHGYRFISKTPLNAIFVYPDKPYLAWIPKSLTKAGESRK